MENAVRQERLKRGWSQVYLSRMTDGIAPADISAIEHGKRLVHPGWQKRIAKAFGMTVEELFGKNTGHGAFGRS